MSYYFPSIPSVASIRLEFGKPAQVCPNPQFSAVFAISEIVPLKRELCRLLEGTALILSKTGYFAPLCFQVGSSGKRRPSPVMRSPAGGTRAIRRPLSNASTGEPFQRRIAWTKRKDERQDDHGKFFPATFPATFSVFLPYFGRNSVHSPTVHRDTKNPVTF